jgi:hypothetical protein
MATSPNAALAAAEAALGTSDPDQRRMMEEMCILVDRMDRPLGGVSKKTSACPRARSVAGGRIEATLGMRMGGWRSIWGDYYARCNGSSRTPVS